MIITGIDPGPTESAVVTITDGKISAHADLDNRDLLCFCRMSDARAVMGIEHMAGYGMTMGKELIDTIWWSGRIYECNKTVFDQIYLITRKDAMLNLCGITAAKEKHVNEALRDRWGDKGTKKRPGATFGFNGHQWAALAIATTLLDVTEGRFKLNGNTPA